jgi:hypothetical protein
MVVSVIWVKSVLTNFRQAHVYGIAMTRPNASGVHGVAGRTRSHVNLIQASRRLAVSRIN